jgi:hypothetical protein
VTLQLGRERSPDWRWSALALALFSATVLVLFRGVLVAGPTDFVVASSYGHERSPETGLLELPRPDSIFHTDQRFVLWLTARNARALWGGPLGFFDAGTCQPSSESLVYGEPGLSLGIVGMPAWLLTRDPVATFNLVLFGLVVLAAFGMYLLVREWTGVPLAGIVAGLLYSFSEVKLGDVVHVNVYDNAWTVLALFFVTRWALSGRWRDAIGLSVCVVLQVGGSFYTVMAALLIAIPMLAWLMVRFDVRQIDKRQLAMIVLALVAVALFVFPPYLSAEAGEGHKAQLYQTFRRLTYLLPGANGFWGWLTILLAALAFLPRHRLVLKAELGDPRWALVIGVLLTMTFSLGALFGEGNYVTGVDPEGFVPYLLFSRFVPGLDVVRGPGAILPGAHLLVCVLAGIGAATLLSRVPRRWELFVAIALVALAWVDTLRPAVLGLTPRVRYGEIRMSPEPADLELLLELGEQAELGPLLEVPVVPKDLVRGSQALVMSAYHWRRTSACYNPSRVSRELFELGRRLPEPLALARAHELGFRDVVLHHARDNDLLHRLKARYDEAAQTDGSERASSLAAPRIVKRGGTPNLTVYRIEP